MKSASQFVNVIHKRSQWRQQKPNLRYKKKGVVGLEGPLEKWVLR